jgi:ABC-2 type transport system ATP-binding protein
MQVRLAFSCAIRAKSDILVLDEVLAVGDEAFQRKCNDYFDKIRKEDGKTVVLVTHSMAAVRNYCNKAILIHNGKIIIDGAPDDVASEYSLENLESVVNSGGGGRAKPSVENFKVKLLSPKQISHNDTIDIEVSFKVMKNEECFVAAVLQDIDRNVPLVIRDSEIAQVSGGKGRRLRASFRLPEVNDSNIKVIVNVRNKNRDILAYYPDHLSPIVAMRRTDYPAHRITDSILYDYKEWNDI